MKKKTVLIFMVTLLVLSLLGCSKSSTANVAEKPKEETATTKKVLVVYHSETGMTETVAKIIQQKLKADIVKIEPKEPYGKMSPDEFKAYVDNQVKEHTKVEIKEPDVDIANYDTIIIGSPTWYGDLSLPIKSYLEGKDFSNMTVALFVTYGGDYKDVFSKFEEVVKAKVIKKGMGFKESDIKSGVGKEVDTWLETIK